MSGKMKALIIVIMILPFLIVLSLLAGGQKPETGKTPRYVIGFVKTATEDSGKAEMNQMVRGICDVYPYQLLEIPVERDQDAQIEAIRALIAYKVDLIVLSPVVGREWETVLREADAAEIPVLTIDQGMAESVNGAKVSYIGFDYYEAAKQLAESYLERVSAENQTLELYGTVGAYSSLQITKGLREVFRERSDRKDELITYSLSEDFLQSRARQATKRIAGSEGGLNVVISHGDAMTIGAVAAVKEAGLHPGKDVLIFAVSCSQEVRQMAEEGEVNSIAYFDLSLLSDTLSDALVSILEEGEARVETALPAQMIQEDSGL
ncbi:substrate-binding domain-containing protein [Lawsonibacter sp. OA9]|uniref:substrate-binding domain-containing protein n=1 Tax=Oscillospiraceae TaxID=216572 RepID=UPI001F060CB3|nr:MULTISPECIES: substrate-binding domain-containing protein [Oscillospiraceae]MCH1978268.1 substrate-binding domain-containing protein [Lawsonibacter sp. OA9]MCH1982223.1 substrate-binding domain-containing protein [Ruminococcus sp. OA3]